MAEENSGGSGRYSLNLNSLLALLTLAGSVWLVSQKLSSDRPVADGNATRAFLGEQTLEARLWEDPFKEPGPNENKGIDFDALIEQVRERSKEQNILVLPATLSGGHYAEDKESRIRSRFAVISALASSKYAPDDGEHLGISSVAWPSRHGLKEALTHKPSPQKLSKSTGGSAGTSLLENITDCVPMPLRFEWHHPRIRVAGTDGQTLPDVLILWIDDSFFEDEPLLRLPLLLEPLLFANSVEGASLPHIALLGPQRSASLKALVRPVEQPGSWSQTNTALWEVARRTLAHIDVYSATPSAMDEALLESSAPGAPREAVRARLIKNGFRAFYNFAATDGQLADEVFDELKLRGADLTAQNRDHLVLISEADTFYGQMLALTYEGRLKRLQKSGGDLRQNMIDYSRKDTNATPSNFHSYTYFRGLDGQTVGSSRDGKSRKDESSKPGSFEDLRKWVPDVNKAEGEAQFDYLGRLGDQLASLERDLHRMDHGHIKAIGIVGSDVYDVLLILQALRSRFPDTIFFTTDLDARIIHPRERQWARNVIVVSGYGLSLNRFAQQSAAPFRDSTQTAQYAAALAALGDDDLQDLGLRTLSPRRFEIGNRAIVDLSADSTWVHPLTRSGEYGTNRDHAKGQIRAAAFIAVLGLLAACWYCGPLARLTFCARRYIAAARDVGALGGALPPPPQPCAPAASPVGTLRVAAAALKEEPTLAMVSAAPGYGDLPSPQSLQAHVKDHFPPGKMPNFDDALGTNTTLETTAKFPIENLKKSVGSIGQQLRSATQPGDVANEESEADLAGRHAVMKIRSLRKRRVAVFWALAVVFGTISYFLSRAIWSDTFVRSDGEPFSLTSGTSAWPGEIIRLAVFALGVWLCFELPHRMRESFFELTRKYRLSFASEILQGPRNWFHFCCKNIRDSFKTVREEATSAAGADAVVLWSKYYVGGAIPSRLVRIIIPTCVYFACLVALFGLFGHTENLRPLRGQAAIRWDKGLLLGAALTFILLSFLTFDAARLCRRFVRALSEAPTVYPPSTRRFFSAKRGNIPEEYLDEWIDLQLIADLTEQVSRLVYYPCCLLLLMILARNSWWDAWTWPIPLVIVFSLNLLLAFSSILVLQKAAQHAKEKAEESLNAKVKQLQRSAAHTPQQQKEADVRLAEDLLQEVRGLQRGAFVPFWQNPVVGAVFLSSGGTTALQILIWCMGR